MIFLFKDFFIGLSLSLKSQRREGDREENKRTEWVIKGVVVLICCVLPCKQPFALASLMETSV